MDWTERGLNIDGIHLNHLRYADDLVLISTDVQELNTMINELDEQSRKVGLKMNLNKTKIISSSQQDVIVNSTVIEKVEYYIYLGHKIKIGKENLGTEIKRRIQLARMAFG